MKLATIFVFGAVFLQPVLGGGGRVINNSPRTLRYTTDPNSQTAPHLCRFWNWSPGDPGSLVKCTQRYLSGGRSIGGLLSSTDVDAFCYAETDYIYNTQRKTKGVWTKFNDLQKVTCTGSASSIPICRSAFQP